MEDEARVNGTSYRILQLLGKGKGGYSYLVSDGEKKYVLKQIHHEPCDYYSFGNKLEAELRDYERLCRVGIPMPRLLAVDEERERILKEYIEGQTIADWIKAGRLETLWLEQVREMCRRLYPAGLNIDYYPTNFIPQGEQLYYVDYECNLYKEEWDFEHWGRQYWRLPQEDNMNQDYIIRLERADEHRAVENLIRESFWNVYRPGCLEHYVIHVLRDDPAFIPELDFVMEQDGRLIGQNMFMKTVILADDGRTIDVLTMGPIGITPELKRRGYGKKLLDHSLEKATEMGFGAVLFEGNIGFYGNSGFDYARKFGIRYHDLPEGADDSFFLCRELIPGYLDGVTGVYQTPQGYYVDEDAADEFDALFPPKVKLKLPGQLF